MEEKNTITIEIPLEEYKELLTIKDKYEELKSQCNQLTISSPLHPNITYLNTENSGIKKEEYPYKVTCEK